MKAAFEREETHGGFGKHRIGNEGAPQPEGSPEGEELFNATEDLPGRRKIGGLSSILHGLGKS
jgi:hypothetical protein